MDQPKVTIIVSDDNCSAIGCTEQRMVWTNDGQRLCLQHAEQAGYCVSCGVLHPTQRLFMDRYGVCRDCYTTGD